MGPAHDVPALMCGAGPSLKYDLDEIKERQKKGGMVFALNAAAKYLNENGIYPDYQVLIDAKEESVSLIGPAREHLFGATVDPKCFELKPDASLFQLQVDDDGLREEIDKLAPYSYEMFTTAVSVGVVGAVVAFAMGHRDMHFYGYDSSHENNDSHVVRQEMNDNVACMEVDFAGKHYLSSLPMKLQAERFMQVANLLKGEGCSVTVHGTGLLPDMYNMPYEKLSEKEKYLRMWSMLSYRAGSPAELIVPLIVEKLKPEGLIIDFGCGTGRAAAAITDLGYGVILTDFAPNCRDECAGELPFVEIDLTEPIPLRAEYGYCVDVIEHIPPDKTDLAIKNIMGSARKVFFQISTVHDRCGVTIKQELHLTVHPVDWWLDCFSRMGYTVEWSQKTEDSGMFLVTR
jgi:hypothetical protein